MTRPAKIIQVPTEIEKINDKLDHLRADMNKLMGYIYNDHDTDAKGLYQQMKEVRKDLDGLLEINRIALAQKSMWGGLGRLARVFLPGK